MSFQDDLPTLVTAMQGKDTLSGWDCLVSYSEDQINQILAENGSSLGIQQLLSWQTLYPDPVTGQNDTMDVSMTMYNPVIQFVDSNGSVTITCPITGNYQAVAPVTGPVIQFPDDIQLVLSTNLVNVTGTFNGDWQPGTTPPNPPNWIVVMEPGGSQTQGVVIDFTNLTAVVENTASGTNSGGNLAVLNSLIQQFIVQYFESATGLQYYLAGVNNGFSSEPGAQVLQPTAFCFTIVPGSSTYSIPATLCMWIALKGSSSTGQMQSGSTLLSFAPDSTQLTPLPTGCSASIIFSHNTMANLFLTPSLSPYFDNVQCTSTTGFSGMLFTLNWPSYQVNVPASDSSDTNMKGCSFNMDTPATSLTISGNLASTSNVPVTISYASPVESMGWTTTTWTDGPFGPTPSTKTGTVEATFTLGGTAQWSNDSVQANELDLTFNIDQTLGCDPVAQSKSFWQKMWGESDSVPPAYDSLHPEAPQIGLTLQMDYFLTTNLLFPGQNVFAADNPVAPNATANQGLASPRDTIFTGQVNMNPAAAAIRYNNLMAEAQTSVTPSPKKLRSKMGPNPNNSDEQTSSGSIDAFKADLLAVPMTPVLGNLINTMSSDTPDVDRKVVTLLASYGYGDLTADDYLSLLSMTSGEVLGGSQATIAGTDTLRSIKYQPAPLSARKDSGVGLYDSTNRSRVSSGLPFDFRMFGASYVVQQPAADEGKVLVVNPVTTVISYRGKDSLPTQSTDPKTSITTVSWTVGESSFDTVFTTFVNSSNLFTVSISGTVTDSTGWQPFSGMMKPLEPNKAAEKNRRASYGSQPRAGRIAKEHAAISKKTLTSSSVPIIELDDYELAVSIIGLIGVGMTCVSLIGCLVPFYWRYNDNKNAERVEKLAAENHKYMLECFDELKAAIRAQGQRAADGVVQAHINDLEELRIPVDAQIAEQTQEGLNTISADQVLGFSADQLSKPPFNTLVDSAGNTLSVLVDAEVQELTGSTVNGVLGQWEAVGVLSDDQVFDEEAQVFTTTGNNVVEPLLNSPTESGPSYTHAFVTSQIFTRSSSLLLQQRTSQETDLEQMQLKMSETSQEEKETEEGLARAQQDAQNETLTDLQRAEWAAAADQLQQDLTRQRALAAKMQREKVDLNENILETDSQRKEAEENQKSSEEQADEAWRDAFVGE